MIEHVGKKIPGNYYIIATDQAGHGEDDSLFDPEEDAKQLKQYLSDQNIQEVEMLYAASMGGLTAMRLMQLGGPSYKRAYLDGIPLAKVDLPIALLARLSMINAWKKTKKDPVSAGQMLSSAYGEEIANLMALQLSKLSKANVDRVIKECGDGCAVPLKKDQCPSMTFDWGEKEINYRKGKPLAEKLYPWAKHVVREGLGHCEYLGKEPDAYGLELKKELEN